jgi:hypothetical protein
MPTPTSPDILVPAQEIAAYLIMNDAEQVQPWSAAEKLGAVPVLPSPREIVPL